MKTSGFRVWWSPWLGVGLAVAVLPLLLPAAERADSRPAATPVAETVELFAAMEKGQIDVKLIPKDSTQARVMIHNKTDRPLSVKLPATFAGVPVLAQAFGGGGGGNNSTNQAMGGGMGMGMGMGGGGMGGGGGFFNVAPEKVGQLKVTTVCLEHGKADPKPSVPYVLKPLEQVTDKAEVREVCRLLGQGQLPQRVAQLAAWHLNNGMSWDQLAAEQYRFANGGGAPAFSPQEIQAAMQLVSVATNLANERAKTVPSDSMSQSQN